MLSMILFAIASFGLATCVSGVLLVYASGRASRRSRRLVEVTRRDEDQHAVGQAIRSRSVQAIHALRARFGGADNAALLERLSSAGLSRSDADLYFAARFLSPVAGLVAGSLAPSGATGWLLIGGAIGYLLPDIWLRRRTRQRRERIRRGVPDAIDLLVVCVGSGLGLDQALLRVGEEIKMSHSDLHHEFLQINREQQVGKPRLEAWQSLADRTQVDEFRAFVNMLTQSHRFGTPLLQALRRLSDEIRMKRRQQAEEKAAKTKIKILFPLVLFIFPCIFIVLLGPAILSIGKSLASIQH